MANLDDKIVENPRESPFNAVCFYTVHKDANGLGVPITLVRWPDPYDNTEHLVGISAAHHSVGRRDDGTVFNNTARYAFRAFSDVNIGSLDTPLRPIRTEFHHDYPITEPEKYGSRHEMFDFMLAVFDVYDDDDMNAALTIPRVPVQRSEMIEEPFVVGYPSTSPRRMMWDQFPTHQLDYRKGAKGHPDYIEFHDDTEPGYSGGPVIVAVNDNGRKQYKLQGFVLRGDSNSTNAFLTTRSDVQQLLNQAVIKTKFDRARQTSLWTHSGIDEVTEIRLRKAEEIKKKEQGGLRIIRVEDKGTTDDMIPTSFFHLDMPIASTTSKATSAGIESMTIAIPYIVHEGNPEIRLRLNPLGDLTQPYIVTGRPKHARLGEKQSIWLKIDRYYLRDSNQLSLDVIGKGTVELLISELDTDIKFTQS